MARRRLPRELPSEAPRERSGVLRCPRLERGTGGEGRMARLRCDDCGDECVRRKRCPRCRMLVCPWCRNHIHNNHVQGVADTACEESPGRVADAEGITDKDNSSL